MDKEEFFCEWLVRLLRLQWKLKDFHFLWSQHWKLNFLINILSQDYLYIKDVSHIGEILTVYIDKHKDAQWWKVALWW